MTSKSPGPQKCRLILNQTLVIQLSRPGNVPDDFWMYDSGYMIFQVRRAIYLKGEFHRETFALEVYSVGEYILSQQ